MRNFFLFLALTLMAVALTGCAKQETRSTTANSPAASAATPAVAANAHDATGATAHNRSVARVPAFQTDAASLKNLAATLSPAKFYGKQKAAYQAVKEIPMTIAQLPCYCYCDEGHGHKSLHSCYEDDHAASCAVCVDEVLLAYKLEKQQKLKPQQIREHIIAQYSSQQ